MRRRRLRQIAPAQPCADPNQDLPITDKLTDKFPVGEIRIVQTGAVDRGLNPGDRGDMRLVRRRQRLANRYRVPPAPALPRTGVLPLNIIHPVQAHRLLENPPWGAGARSRQYQTAAGSQYSTP